MSSNNNRNRNNGDEDVGDKSGRERSACFPRVLSAVVIAVFLITCAISIGISVKFGYMLRATLSVLALIQGLHVMCVRDKRRREAGFVVLFALSCIVCITFFNMDGDSAYRLPCGVLWAVVIFLLLVFLFSGGVRRWGELSSGEVRRLWGLQGREPETVAVRVPDIETGISPATTSVDATMEDAPVIAMVQAIAIPEEPLVKAVAVTAVPVKE